MAIKFNSKTLNSPAFQKAAAEYYGPSEKEELPTPKEATEDPVKDPPIDASMADLVGVVGKLKEEVKTLSGLLLEFMASQETIGKKIPPSNPAGSPFIRDIAAARAHEVRSDLAERVLKAQRSYPDLASNAKAISAIVGSSIHVLNKLVETGYLSSGSFR